MTSPPSDAGGTGRQFGDQILADAAGEEGTEQGDADRAAEVPQEHVAGGGHPEVGSGDGVLDGDCERRRQSMPIPAPQAAMTANTIGSGVVVPIASGRP